jgi:LAO/AO transport system kinase
VRHVDRVVEGLLAGRRRDLARALTAVETGDEAVVRQVLAAVHPRGGRAHTVGVTGPPGVGKSTTTARVVAELVRRGRRVAVLAVDPSSPFTGGALLGDRLRMGDVATHEGVYIRSMATRGHLGGLAWAAPHAVAVLDAAGFDVVLVETVGVGQAEVEVASLADTCVVVSAPGLGDAVQAAKAGVLEVADVHVVNKADTPGARRTAQELRGALQLRADGDEGGWDPPVLLVAAERDQGTAALVDQVEAHRTWAEASGARAVRRRRAAAAQVRELVLARLRARLDPVGWGGDALDQAVEDVAARRRDPYAVADDLVDRLGLPGGAAGA